MTDSPEYNTQTFLSRVLGNGNSNSNGNGNGNSSLRMTSTTPQDGANQGSGNDGDRPFSNDDLTDLQFSQHKFMDTNVKNFSGDGTRRFHDRRNMIMSEVSLGADDHDPIPSPSARYKNRLHSHVSINFNSESESSSDEGDDEYDGNGSGAGVKNISDKNDRNSSDNNIIPPDGKKNEKFHIREELENELGFDDYVPESLLMETYSRKPVKKTDKYIPNGSGMVNKLEQSFMHQFKEAERKLKPKLDSWAQNAKTFTNNTLENSFINQNPTFISNKREQSFNNKKFTFNARKLPPKERAYWMWSNVTNLDLFLNDVYEYYVGFGFNCILLSKSFNILIIVFVVLLTSWLKYCINYELLFNSQANNLKDVLVKDWYLRITLSEKVFYVILIFLLFLRIKNAYKELVNLKEIQIFYNYLLKIEDSELQTISWPQIVRKIMILKNKNTNALVTTDKNPDLNDLKSKNKLNAHDIANRLMRRENYLIAIFNRNLLNNYLKIPILNRFYLTNTLEWNLKLCIIDFLFNYNGQLKKKVLSEHNRLNLIVNLRKRFRMAGLLSIVLTPFLVIYFILYYFLKFFYDFKTNPGLLNARTYSPIAKWKFREYNELPHLFDQRINNSIEFADIYFDQFPKELSNIILKFLSFISGSLVSILVILTIFDHENFLNFEITEGKTVLFYISTLGAVFTICRNSISDSKHKYLFNPETLLKKVADDTHYLPSSWTGRYHTVEIKNQFSELYNLKLVLMFKELLSLILLPYILYFRLPEASDKIIDFFRDYTLRVDGIGYVCSFAMFKLEENKDYSKNHGVKTEELPNRNDDVDEKMVKSYIHFIESYGNENMKVNQTELHKRNPKRNNNLLLKSAVLNNSNNQVQANNTIDGMSMDIKQKGIHPFREQMEDSSAGLYSPNTKNYINGLSNSVMLGESFHLGQEDAIEEEDESDTDTKPKGGVLGLITNIYQDKKRIS